MKERVIIVYLAGFILRLPNFLLPILAFRLFEYNEYGQFVTAFATSAAITALLGDAISLTISRMSYHAKNETGSNELAVFFWAACIGAVLLVAACLVIYQAIFSIINLHDVRWPSVIYPILFAPSYLFPIGLFALAHAHQKAHISAIGIFISVPLSLLLSLYMGHSFGLEFFFSTYFLIITTAAIILFFKITPNRIIGSPHLYATAIKNYIPTFMAILVPSLLGGPLHGICLAMLNFQTNGLVELAKFVAYYPWAMAVTLPTAVLANYTVQSLSISESKHKYHNLITKIKQIVFFNATTIVAIGAILFIFQKEFLSLYNSVQFYEQSLFNWTILCGICSALVMLTTQVLVALDGKKELALCAVLHAVFYLSISFVNLTINNAGAVGLAQSLTTALLLLFLEHFWLIFKKVKIIKMSNAY